MSKQQSEQLRHYPQCDFPDCLPGYVDGVPSHSYYCMAHQRLVEAQLAEQNQKIGCHIEVETLGGVNNIKVHLVDPKDVATYYRAIELIRGLGELSTTPQDSTINRRGSDE